MSTTLQSYIAGQWLGSQPAQSLRSAVNGHAVAHTHAEAIDFESALHFARTQGRKNLLALGLAIVVPALVGMALEKLAIEPVMGAETVTLIIITIGASLVIRGLVQVWLGKGTFSLPAFSGEKPILFLGATLMPQSLWVLGVSALVVLALGYFFKYGVHSFSVQ